MEPFDWDDILEDIAEQKAVLLLGHNFLPGAQEQLHAALNDKLGDKLQHFHGRDGLFLFRDGGDTKTTAQQVAARIYRNYVPDEVILKKIAEMPFRLMVSANPDKFLPDTFAQYKLRLQFDYFSSNHKEQDYKVVRPTEENPLLYNLCGSVEDQESLILDYDDLFKMLKTLLADLKIPNEIRLPLMKATTYIFVGFHFERWYTQLFLRYLNMNDNRFSNKSRNYVLKTTFQDTDMERFFLQQFNVRYIGADWTFFEELHRRFAEKYPAKMRRLIDQLSPTAAAVSQLVARGEYASAISMLNLFKSQLYADEQIQLIATEADYNRYLADKDGGAVLTEHLNVNLAKVRNNILDLAKKIA